MCVCVCVCVCVCRVGDEDEDDLSSDESSEMDSEQDSHSADDTVNKPEPGNSKIQAVLNSAGSSDEGTHSKPSDEEDSESIQKSTPHSDSGSVADEGGGADKTTGVTEELSRVNERETEGERSVGDGCNTAQEKANTEGAEEVEKAEAGGKNKEKEAPESHNEENKEEIPANHTPPQDNVSFRVRNEYIIQIHYASNCLGAILCSNDYRGPLI